MILPKSFIDAMDAVLDISLVYGLDDMKVINEWKITPCLLYVKGEIRVKEGGIYQVICVIF